MTNNNPSTPNSASQMQSQFADKPVHGPENKPAVTPTAPAPPQVQPDKAALVTAPATKV